MITKSRVAFHPKFAAIIATYNEKLKADGRVNNRKFYRDYLVPDMPDLRYDSWYEFLRKFRVAGGIVNVQPAEKDAGVINAPDEEMKSLERTFLSNEQATQRGIALMLNIGSETLEKLLSNPEELSRLSLKDRVELLTKAMKAQDSRIHAIGKVKEDGREQAKFNRLFNSAAFEE